MLLLAVNPGAWYRPDGKVQSALGFHNKGERFFADRGQNGATAVGLLLVCQTTVQTVNRSNTVAGNGEEVGVRVTHGDVCLPAVSQGNNGRCQRTAEGGR